MRVTAELWGPRRVEGDGPKYPWRVFFARGDEVWLPCTESRHSYAFLMSPFIQQVSQRGHEKGGGAYPGWPLPSGRSQNLRRCDAVWCSYFCLEFIRFDFYGFKFRSEASVLCLAFKLYRLRCLGSPSEVSTSDLFDLPPVFCIFFLENL